MEDFDTTLRPLGSSITLRNDPSAEQSRHFQVIALEGGGFATIWLAQSGFASIRLPNPDLVVQIFDADARALTGPLSLTGETGLNATVLTGRATATGGLSMVLETADLSPATIVDNATGLVQITTDAMGVETARRTLPVPEDLVETGFELNAVTPLADGGLILDLDRGAYYTDTETRALYLYDAEGNAPRRLDPSETDARDGDDGLQVFVLDGGALLLVRLDDDRADGAEETVTFQRIAADGSAIDATPIEVARLNDAYGSAHVIAGAQGTFQLIWREYTPDGPNPRNAIYTQTFAADGTASGAPRLLYSDADPDPVSAPQAVLQADGDLALLYETDLRDPYGAIPIQGGYSAFVLDTGEAFLPLAVGDGPGREQDRALTLLPDGDVIVSWDAFTPGVGSPSGVSPSTTWPVFQRFGLFANIVGGAGDDTLTGTEGQDVLRGLDGADTLTGLDGHDQLDGGKNDDLLDGGAGDDTLAGGNGADSIDGGAGNDLIRETEEGDGPDTIDGGAGRDTIAGGRGSDRIDGGEDDDVITGGNARDTIDGGTGNDSLYGGSGQGDPDDALYDRGDVMYGGAGNDSLDGGYGNDVLRGDAGNDTLAGGFGGDTLIGGAGNDLIAGGALGDVLFGSDGDDFLNGGFGFDRLNGGPGADRFFHTGTAGHGSDWIQDFTAVDALVFGDDGADAAQFQINTALTGNAGAADVAEAFVIYRPTGQILWALVDGGALDSATLNIDSESFDLMV